MTGISLAVMLAFSFFRPREKKIYVSHSNLPQAPLPSPLSNASCLGRGRQRKEGRAEARLICFVQAPKVKYRSPTDEDEPPPTVSPFANLIAWPPTSKLTRVVLRFPSPFSPSDQQRLLLLALSASHKGRRQVGRYCWCAHVISGLLNPSRKAGSAEEGRDSLRAALALAARFGWYRMNRVVKGHVFRED
jgi:hypothetical protein